MDTNNIDLCPDESIQKIRKYLKEISQPIDEEDSDISQLSLLTKDQLDLYIKNNF